MNVTRRFFDGAANEIGLVPIEAVASDSTISANRIESSAVFYAPSVAGGTVYITLNSWTTSSAVYNPSVQDEPTIQSILLNRIKISTAIPSAVVTAENTIDGSRIESVAAVLPPTVSASASISLSTIESTANLYDSIVSASASVSLLRIESTASLFAAVVESTSQVSLPHLSSTASVLSPTVASAATIALSKIESNATFQLLEFAQVVELLRVESPTQIFALEAAQVWVISVASWESSSALFPLLVTSEKIGAVDRIKQKKTAGGGLAFIGGGRLNLRRSSRPRGPIRP